MHFHCRWIIQCCKQFHEWFFDIEVIVKWPQKTCWTAFTVYSIVVTIERMAVISSSTCCGYTVNCHVNPNACVFDTDILTVHKKWQSIGGQWLNFKHCFTWNCCSISAKSQAPLYPLKRVCMNISESLHYISSYQHNENTSLFVYTTLYIV